MFADDVSLGTFHIMTIMENKNRTVCICEQSTEASLEIYLWSNKKILPYIRVSGYSRDTYFQIKGVEGPN